MYICVDSLAGRIRTLFYIALSNFVLPGESDVLYDSENI
jgi:hypothetical protein